MPNTAETAESLLGELTDDELARYGEIARDQAMHELRYWGVQAMLGLSALGSAFWGTGMFMDGAHMVIDFAFNTIKAHRLEARAAILNGRGNGALRKIGAMQEGILRKSFLRNGEYLDQALWTILDEDWRAQRTVWGPRIH